MEWKWDIQGMPYIKSIDDDAPVSPCCCMISGRNSHLSPMITRVEWSKGRRTLGVCLAPDGSCTTELSLRLLQAQQWMKNIQKGFFTREEYTAYITMWQPNMEFPLTVTDHQTAASTAPSRIYRPFPVRPIWTSQNNSTVYNLWPSPIQMWIYFGFNYTTCINYTPAN